MYNKGSSGMNGVNAANKSSLTSANGSCVLCGKHTDCKCDRCGDFYCSELCQQKDWRSHRYICFPMPKLIKVGPCSPENIPISPDASQPANIKEVNLLKSTNIVPNGSCVVLTGFKSTNRCYIRTTNPTTVAEYNNILNQIDEFGKNSSVLSDRPKFDSYALALRDGRWCRVNIFKAQKGSCRFAYIDYGDVEERYFKDLRKIDRSLVKLPTFIQLVQLKGITSYSIDSKQLDTLKQYTNKEYKIVFDHPETASGEVKLFQWGTDILLNSIIEAVSQTHKDKDSDCQSNVSLMKTDLKIEEKSDRGVKKVNGAIAQTQLNDTRIQKTSEADTFIKNTNDSLKELDIRLSLQKVSAKASEAEPRHIQKRCITPPFKTIAINEDDKNCKVLIMDNSFIESGYIGCLLEKYYENLKLITKFLKENEAGDQPYKPMVNEYCLANYENEWYRAKVVEIVSDDKFLVLYIDFTNEMELSSASIRPYPMSLNYPCCTTLCAIEGLPEDISEELKNFLEENCQSFTFLNIESVHLNEMGMPFIKSNELLKKIRDSNVL